MRHRLSLCLTALLVTLVVTSTSLRAQPSAALLRRITQVTALIVAEPAGIDTMFGPSFLRQVPAPQFAKIARQYYDNAGTVTRWRFLDSTKKDQAKVRCRCSKGYSFDMTIAVSDAPPNQIVGLFFTAPTPEVASIDAIIDSLRRLPGTVSLLAARFADGSDTKQPLETLHAFHADQPLALGSAFKLYILAELVREIEAGERHWSDVVTLDSESRSFPSGMMHAWPVGSSVTLATAATMMISISDNTATDLLLHTLGRAKVEAMLATAGHQHAAATTPFLTTAEMFKLKSKGMALGHAYLATPAAERHAFLDGRVRAFSHDSVNFTGEVSLIDSIEWFASAEDLARVMQYLAQHTASGEAALARKILSVNPGLSIDHEQWSYIGYKGGSEPGVLDLTFLLRHGSGPWYVLTATWNDPKAPLAEERFEGFVQRAIELLH